MQRQRDGLVPIGEALADLGATLIKYVIELFGKWWPGLV